MKTEPGTGTSTATGNTGVSGETGASSASDNTASNATDDVTEASASAQIPDNIKLDLGNVDIVYEMNDGISNIAISNRREAVGETENVVEVPASGQEGTLTNTPPLNWYEVVKMLLLAAIFIVVIPKPNLKKNS